MFDYAKTGGRRCPNCKGRSVSRCDAKRQCYDCGAKWEDVYTLINYRNLHFECTWCKKELGEGAGVVYGALNQVLLCTFCATDAKSRESKD